MTDRGKIAVITGGAKGIGAAVVQLFLDSGMEVAVLDLERPSQNNVLFILCDVSQEDQVEAAFQQVVQHYGEPDILVNNAGIQRYGSITETSAGLWDEVMNVNLKSMFLCARQAIPMMQKKGAGVIINVSSVQAFHTQQNVAAYTTAKTAILGLTRSIAVDYAPAIRCVAVCPGTIDTPMLREAINLSPDPGAVLLECENMHLTKRIGQPAEVAQLILFLCGEHAAFITGQAIRIDGGLGIMIQGSKK